MPTNNSKFPLGLTRTEATIFYVIHTLDGLKKTGMVEGGFAQVTEKGEKIFEQLQAAGFEPSEDEIKAALAGIQAFGLKLEGGK